MTESRETNVHITTGGKYPDLRVYLEAVLSGDSLDAVEDALNDYTQFLSLRTHDSGDPTAYQELEQRTEKTFNEVAGCVPVAAQEEFFRLLAKLASRTHAYAFNPFMAARALVALASHAFERISADRSSAATEARRLAGPLERLQSVANHFKGIRPEALAEGLKAFGALHSDELATSPFYDVAHPCVQAIDRLTRLPDVGEGPSWDETGRTFWKNLKFYAPMSRTKMLAAGQLSRLLQLG